MNELQKVGSTDLITFNDKQVGLIKRTIAVDATDDELALFLHQCQRTGLDPLARQIYFQKYNTKKGPKMSVFTGIDGYRLVADRTGKYAGSDEPVFSGKITEVRYREKFDAPAKATVTVWKLVAGQRVAFSAAAYWKEYYPGEKKGKMWQKMPHVMLAKCAESHALRKAFPADLSGVYTREEMSQSDWVEAETITHPVVITDNKMNSKPPAHPVASDNAAALEAEIFDTPPKPSRKPPAKKPAAKPVKKPAKSTNSVDWASKALNATSESAFYSAASFFVDGYRDAEHVKNALAQRDDYEYDPANNAELLQWLADRKEKSNE